MLKENQKKIIYFILLIVIVFTAFFVWSFSYNQKGYLIDSDTSYLITARNLSLNQKYSLADEKGIVLSSTSIVEKGAPASVENKLTPIIYSNIFKIFGYNVNLPFQISLITYIIAALVLFILAWRLFNIKIAFIFILTFIFTPQVINYVNRPGNYEFPLFFLSLALLFYFWNDYKIKTKKTFINLILAGIFFSLAFLSRNAFLISFIPFLIYDFFKTKSFKRGLSLIIPFIIILSIFFVPDLANKQSYAYSSLFTKKTTELNLHAFPDSYTYYFEKEEYINEIKDQAEGDVMATLMTYGQKFSLKEKLSLYLNSIKYYTQKFLRLVVFGGPIMFIFLFIGLLYLFKKNKNLSIFFITWFIFWFAVLIYCKTSNYNHFLEIIFPIIILISLGIYWFFDLLNNHLEIKKNKKYLIILLISLCFVGHLIIANKWLFHENYTVLGADKKIPLIQAIQKEKMSSEDIIATDSHPTIILELNYYTDTNLIRFDSTTIEKLLAKNKLKSAFEYYGVTKIIDYQPELTQKIIEQTGIDNIEINF